jgi:hypothetical protein
MAGEARWGSLPFDEAIRFFAGKRLVPTERWSDLWHEAHDAGFMVAGAMKADLLADLQSAVGKAIEKGTTLAEFRKDFDRIVARQGWHGWTGENWEGGRNWRTLVIYDTNLRMSYSAGRWAQIQANPTAAPYLIYRHSDLSAHPRPLHKSWDGLVVAASDPWVKTHWPPNGWGCKCRMFALSERDLKKLGKAGPDAPPDDGTFQWIDKRTGETFEVPKGIDPGFGYTPGASRRDLTREAVGRKLETLPGAIAQQLRPVAQGPAPAPPVVPPATVPGRARLPEFREAATLREAAALTRQIVRATNEVPYATRTDGRPAVRFRHGRTKDVAGKIFGQADLSGLDVATANALNRTLLELQAECDRLGIPRIRAVHTRAGSAGASMGDGVLAVSPNQASYFRTGPVLEARRANQPPSTWKPGDPGESRPFLADHYLEWGPDRFRNTLLHEFAHHIHQQYGARGLKEYLSPALEAVLSRLVKAGNNARIVPSKYAATNSKEWFAESYSLYKAGRSDLVDPALIDVIERVERGEVL